VSLYRDEKNHIEPVPKADAFPELMKRAFISRNPVMMARIMALEKRLLETVDFYKLGCNMDPEAAAIARGGIKAR
jgi:hypothetical protein